MSKPISSTEQVIPNAEFSNSVASELPVLRATQCMRCFRFTRFVKGIQIIGTNREPKSSFVIASAVGNMLGLKYGSSGSQTCNDRSRFFLTELDVRCSEGLIRVAVQHCAREGQNVLTT